MFIVVCLEVSICTVKTRMHLKLFMQIYCCYKVVLLYQVNGLQFGKIYFCILFETIFVAISVVGKSKLT